MVAYGRDPMRCRTETFCAGDEWASTLQRSVRRCAVVPGCARTSYVLCSGGSVARLVETTLSMFVFSHGCVRFLYGCPVFFYDDVPILYGQWTSKDRAGARLAASGGVPLLLLCGRPSTYRTELPSQRGGDPCLTGPACSVPRQIHVPHQTIRAEL